MKEHPLTRWRREQKLSGRGFAERVGVSERMIRYIEKGGGCGVDVAVRLSRYTHIPVRSFGRRAAS